MPGESAYVQLRLEETLTAQRNDRFVIRNYSPMYTIGGGIIIEPAAKKAKRFDSNYIEELKIKESGSAESILEKTIEKLSCEYPDETVILKALGKNEENLEEKLNVLLKDKIIVKLTSLDKPLYIHKNYIKQKTSELEKLLSKYHQENPLKAGISKEEIKNKIFGKNIKQKTYDEVLKLLEERNVISFHGSFIALKEFQIKYNKDQQRIKDKIIATFKDARYNPPKYEDLAAAEKDKKSFKMVYDSLLDMGELSKASEECVFLNEYYEDAKKLVVDFIKEKGSISAAEARDLFNTSRKFAVSLLENFDSLKLTKRVEDVRVLY
jgi:selenocysteine-specific elongation factor